MISASPVCRIGNRWTFRFSRDAEARLRAQRFRKKLCLGLHSGSLSLSIVKKISWHNDTWPAKDNVLLVKTAKQACANTDDTCIVNLKRVPHGSFPHIASSILLRTFPPVVHLEDKTSLLRLESSLKPWKTTQKVFQQAFFCDIYSNLPFANHMNHMHQTGDAQAPAWNHGTWFWVADSVCGGSNFLEKGESSRSTFQSRNMKVVGYWIESCPDLFALGHLVT